MNAIHLKPNQCQCYELELYRQSYSSFTRMTSFFNITVPEYIMKRLDPVKEDDEAVKDIGCEIAIDIATKILTTPLDNGGMDGVHFYTLNLERSVTRILMAMNAVSTLSGSDGNDAIKENVNLQQISPSLAPMASHRRQYPWRPSAMERREKEDVRPINWANRPTSYVLRTEDWDEFPNGRWGDSTSPAFGELSDLSHFYSFSLGTEEDRLAMLGPQPLVPQDVYEVFAKYVEGKVPHLPWCETTLKPESFTIQSKLADLNRAGFLTINSQPAINGIASNNTVFGWGGPGGYVYQKGYIECFAGPENLPVLLDMVAKQESLNLYAVNYSGEEIRAGVDEGGVTALTWGVFPNREILQPTIFDPQTYLIWAEEAFSLWTTMWLNLYDFESRSYSLIEDIRDNYFLVAIIDNDFVSSDGVSLCDKILEAKRRSQET
jgi:5,10-methylenetetrahydrofolate reductase